ncbi:MAG: phage protein Gp37 [Sphingomonas sp.]
MIAAIELAMLERLKAVADAGGTGFAWKTRTTYPDDWEEYLNTDASIKCPAVWVVFAGWQDTELTSDDQLIVRGGMFGVMVADENLRESEQYQRHGGENVAKEPGSYRLALAALASLANQTLGLDLVKPLSAGTLRPVAPTAASQKRRMSRYAILFTCDFPIALVGDGETDPAELLALHANWDIPTFGDPVAVDADPVADGVQLPDDFRANATDHISLEQE